MAKIREREFDSALETLTPAETPLEEMIRAHALCESGKLEEALKSLEQVPSKAPAVVVELTAAIRERYLAKPAGSTADDFILEKECRVRLMAA